MRDFHEMHPKLRVLGLVRPDAQMESRGLRREIAGNA